MSIPANRRNITAEELLQHPEWEPCELIAGEVVPLAPTKRRHVRVACKIIGALDRYQERIGRGFAGGTDGGIVLRRNPDTVRAPDASFTFEDADYDGFEVVPPALCVEVLSESNRWREIRDKVQQYLDFGVKLVWVVVPKERSVHIYLPDGSTQVLGESETLTGQGVLEEFELPVARIFS